MAAAASGARSSENTFRSLDELADLRQNLSPPNSAMKQREMAARGHNQSPSGVRGDRQAQLMGASGLAWRSDVVILSLNGHQCGASDGLKGGCLIAKSELAPHERLKRMRPEQTGYTRWVGRRIDRGCDEH